MRSAPGGDGTASSRPYLSIRQAGAARRAIKRAFDVGLASLGMVVLGVLLPPVALAIYIDSPGPVFYTQERIGRGGVRFRMYKLRTMVPGAERGEALWADEDDRRVTRVGRILRKLHLDELPQCLNVLQGHMSAVGPRPERPEFAELLAAEIPHYDLRHTVRPGMAGWALVQQGYTATRRGAALKLQHDLYYIEHQSLWLDVVILARTMLRALAFKGR